MYQEQRRGPGGMVTVVVIEDQDVNMEMDDLDQGIRDEGGRDGKFFVIVFEDDDENKIRKVVGRNGLGKAIQSRQRAIARKRRQTLKRRVKT